MNNPPRHSKLAAKILNDPEYIPTRDEYKQICECKEARNFLHPEEAEPLYPAGSLIKISHKAGLSFVPMNGKPADMRGKLGVVVKVEKDDRMFPSNPGNFVYHILPQGQTDTIMLNEKDMKNVEIKE